MPKKRRKKFWSHSVVEGGVEIRIFERAGSSALWYSVVQGGEQTRRSLKTRDRGEAEIRARAIAKELDVARATGARPETLTVAQLRAVYIAERARLLTAARKREVGTAFDLFERHVGRDFLVADLGSHQVETYVAARQEGTLVTTTGNHGGGKVRAGTITKELGVLRAALNWAETFKRGGKPLVARNPIRGVQNPQELNPARPRASQDRYKALRAQADVIDATGCFRTMLDLAWFTGRRLGAIVALRASDVLLTREQLERALADSGREEDLAEWPAAIRWDPEADKEGVEWIVPIPEVLRAALAEYVKARQVVGGALLFPARGNPDTPVAKTTAYYWLRTAEKRAKLLRVERGGWHSFRRAWATARKHMPLKDVMAAGGWRDPSSLQKAYQHADARTIRDVMELGA